MLVLWALLVMGADAWAQGAPPAEPAGSAAPAAPAPSASASDMERFQGSYTFVGGSKEQADLSEAIDRVVGDFFFIKGLIVKGRLSERNPVFQAVSIAFPDGMIEVKLDSTVLKSPSNGEFAPGKSPAGDDAKVSHKFEDGKLVQVVEGEHGTRRNEFILSSDGGELLMNVKMTSPRLPKGKGLYYRLTYRRASGK
jgi:hypothetical protein